MVTGDTAWGILQHAKAHGASSGSKWMSWKPRLCHPGFQLHQHQLLGLSSPYILLFKAPSTASWKPARP